jgi:threonine dehydratase
MYIPTYQDMLEAHERHHAPHPAHASPHVGFLNEMTGADLFFKCENSKHPVPSKCAVPAMHVGLDDEQAKLGVAAIHRATRPASAMRPAVVVFRCNVVMLRARHK